LNDTHVAVVGAGIVGLAVAYHLTKGGAQVTLIDRDPEGDNASSGSAGGIAVTEVFPASSPGVLWRAFGWMLDPLGPLAIRPRHAPKLVPWLFHFAIAGPPAEVDRISRALAALNARVYEDLLPMLDATHLAGELHRKGALTVYQTEEGFRRDAAEWACKRARGIVVEEMSGADARAMEPALGSCVQRALFTPEWSHVSDPKDLLQGLKEWLLRAGVEMMRGEVRTIASGPTSASAHTSKVALRLDDGKTLSADQAVVAAGAWSGILARRMGDRVLLESERGYNMTLPRPGILLEREVIFAEHKFVATPLKCGLRIGGAAEFGGLDAPANFKRSQALVELARRYLPGLRTEGGATSWAGHRPTTPDSLPVIGPAQHRANVWYAFGHGHVGLTHAATTGRLIGDLIFRTTPPIELTPYSVERFSCSERDPRCFVIHSSALTPIPAAIPSGSLRAELRSCRIYR
jgi:D-amino-acid dehydrogenase